MKFELVNNEGCLMDEVDSKSFQLARKYFADKFEGNYKIICAELSETKNVRL